jgi:hypothetical protein
VIVSPTQILFWGLFPIQILVFPRLRSWSWACFPDSDIGVVPVSPTHILVSVLFPLFRIWFCACFPDSRRVRGLLPPTHNVFNDCFPDSDPVLGSVPDSDIGVSPTQILELGLFPRLRYWFCACFPDSDPGFGPGWPMAAAMITLNENHYAKLNMYIENTVFH